MSHDDLIKQLRHGAANIHSIGPVRAAALLEEAAGALCSVDERVDWQEEADSRGPLTDAELEAIGEPDPAERERLQSALDTAGTIRAAARSLGLSPRKMKLLMIQHRPEWPRPRVAMPPLSSLLDGPDPAPVALPPRPDPDAAYKERVRSYFPAVSRPGGARLEVVGGDGETIRALGLPEPINQLRTRRLYSTPPEGPLAPIDDIDLVVLAPAPAPAKPLVSIVLPALRFEDKRITSSNTLSVLCGDREVWTGKGTCELDIRTTVVENQISYAHPLTFDSMMEAKGTIWLQANDEAAALLQTYRNGSIGLVLCFPAAQSFFTALLFDVADGERPPSSEPGWLGFTLALETP